MTPLEFLTLLWRDKPEQLYVLIWTWPDKRSRWFRELPAAAQYIATISEKDIYTGVGLSKQDYGPTQRCESKDIAGLTGLWADLDLRSLAHASKALPATIAAALSIVPASLPPTIVILTGNGMHCWWLFKEPLIFESDEERNEAARLAARWSTLLRLKAANCGWAFDRLSDLARVLRIPGTRNYKESSKPKDVVVHSSNDATRYNLSDFAEFLDDAGIPDTEAQESAARDWAARFEDKPLAITPGARIPQDILDGWMALDMRFRNTWLRQRHDLKDQSQSGYDLALADFGMDAGLPEQQIVDLIIHHRDRYSQQQRVRLDYYQRTITKAAKRSEWRSELRQSTEVPPLPGSPKAATAEQPAPKGAPGGGSSCAANPDPAAAKAILCEQISAVIGVRVLRLVKLTGKEPTYHMWLAEGTPIEFPGVAKFISQSAVRIAIAAETDNLMPPIKPKLWQEVAQAMLKACFVEQGGEEQEWQGAARMYITQYLSDTGFIDAVEGQMVQNQRKPMIVDGRIAICSSDLQLYIVRNLLQNPTVRAVASMVKALGATHIRVRGSRRKDQSRWTLPLEEFDPQDYQKTAQTEVASDGG